MVTVPNIKLCGKSHLIESNQMDLYTFFLNKYEGLDRRHNLLSSRTTRSYEKRLDSVFNNEISKKYKDE